MKLLRKSSNCYLLACLMTMATGCLKSQCPKYGTTELQTPTVNASIDSSVSVSGTSDNILVFEKYFSFDSAHIFCNDGIIYSATVTTERALKRFIKHFIGRLSGCLANSISREKQQSDYSFTERLQTNLPK